MIETKIGYDNFLFFNFFQRTAIVMFSEIESKGNYYYFLIELFEAS